MSEHERVSEKARAAFDQAQRKAGARRRATIFAGAFAVTLLALGATWLARRSGSGAVSARGGDFVLQVIAKRADKTWRPRRGETLRKGDQLQFELRGVQRPGYLYLLTIDALNVITLEPPGNKPPRRIDAGLRYQAPGAMILDDRPGLQRAFALVCQRPLPSGELDRSTRRLIAKKRPIASIERLPLACAQGSFVFDKAR